MGGLAGWRFRGVTRRADGARFGETTTHEEPLFVMNYSVHMVNHTETQANLEIVHRFFDSVWNRGDLAVCDEIVGVNHVHHLGQRQINGPDAVKSLVRSLRAAFPDL